MFYECNQLSSLNINNFIKSEVIDMSNMFYKCSNLESLDLSKFDISKLEKMATMFSECSTLKSLYLSNFDTSNVLDNSMNDVFEGCSSLEYINLYNYKGKDIFTSINDYTQLTICTRDYTENDSSLITNNVINRCSTIKLVFTNKNGQNVKFLNPEFRNIPKYVSQNNIEINIIPDNFEMILDNNDINEIKITWENKLTDLSEMFKDCFDINEIYFEKDLFDSSEVTNMKYIFSGCSFLSYLKLQMTTTNLEDIEGILENCNKLEEIKLEEFTPKI